LLVAYLLSLGFQPDLVLNIDGFNECALANTNIEHHVHPASRPGRTGRTSPRASAPIARRSTT
jgi:hypothetical protein